MRPQSSMEEPTPPGMSHISFESIRIDTSRIASHAEPPVRPSHPRAILYWHVMTVTWFIVVAYVRDIVEIARQRSAAASSTQALVPLLMAAVTMWLWWIFLRRGGTMARAGAAIIAVLSGARAMTAYASVDALMFTQQLHIYGAVAMLLYAAFGSSHRRVTQDP
jgi:hypothetical protein